MDSVAQEFGAVLAQGLVVVVRQCGGRSWNRGLLKKMETSWASFSLQVVSGPSPVVSPDGLH